MAYCPGADTKSAFSKPSLVNIFLISSKEMLSPFFIFTLPTLDFNLEREELIINCALIKLRMNTYSYQCNIITDVLN